MRLLVAVREINGSAWIHGGERENPSWVRTKCQIKIRFCPSETRRRKIRVLNLQFLFCRSMPLSFCVTMTTRWVTWCGEKTVFYGFSSSTESQWSSLSSLCLLRFVPLFLVLFLFFSGCFSPSRREEKMTAAGWTLLVPNAAYYWSDWFTTDHTCHCTSLVWNICTLKTQFSWINLTELFQLVTHY